MALVRFAPQSVAALHSIKMLRTSTALSSLLAVAAFASPAYAANECGPATSGAVVCTAAGNPYAGGISYTPTGNLQLTTNSDVAATGTVSVNGTGTTQITNNGTITTTGAGTSFTPGAQGIFARGSSVSVGGTGAISTSGLNARGVDAATSGAGAVTVNVGNVTTTGTGGGGPGFFPNSSAIFANTDAGAITVTGGTLQTAGDFASGVQAISNTGDITINTGAITTTGANANGVSAQSYTAGTVAVTSTGTIGTSGQAANGVSVYARNGTATAHVANVNATGFNAAGILVNGGTAANASFGSVTTAGSFGQGVYAQSSGDVTVSGTNVTTAGTDAAAVYAFSDTGNVAVTTTGTVATTGGSSRGIYAYSNSGNTAVVAKNVTTTGNNSDAIVAVGANASVTISGTVSTQGHQAYNNSNANAVLVKATDGVATVVNNGSVSTAGDNATAILATATQGIAISGSGSVATTGYHALGIDANSAAGPVSVTTGNISTHGGQSIGLRAQGNGAVTVVTGAVTTTGAGAIGVEATGLNAAPPPVDDVLSFAVAAVDQPAGVSVTTGAVKTSGAYAAGVLAYSSSGPVTINVASVATTGPGSVGVQGRGGGAVNITTGTASSASREAVYAGSFTDAATVTLNGATTGAGGNAVFIAAATSATLNLGTGGSLTAAGGGADLLAGTTATINNAGTITGDGTAPILTVFNAAPLTFNNSGTFTGTVQFATGSNDTVNNSGTYNAKYDQNFGTGTDTFNNSGTFRVLPGSTTAGTVHLTGLEAFNNSGLVDLRNGHTGDVLSTSSTFKGSGASTLGIDVNFANAGSTSFADQLTAAGAITGSTTLAFNQIGANGAILNTGTVFATGGAGSSATAFSLTSASQDVGLIRYGVVFNPANNTYSLVGTPGDSVFRALKINEGAQQLWYKSADTLTAHLSDLRDAKFAGAAPDGGRIWGQIYGGVVTHNSAQTFSTFGLTRTVDLSYRQDAYGVQLGVDLGSRDMGSGNFVFGITGGYLSSDLTFAGSADRVTYSVVNGGAYASYVSGGLFLNVLGKYDYIWADSKSPASGYADKFHGSSYGAQGEAGIRFGGDRFYAEPVATIAYVHTDLKNIQALGQTIGFDNLDGLRGKAGLRVGSKLDLAGGSVAVIYAQGNYVHEFKGKDGIDFTSGGTTVSYDNQKIGDYGEAKLGINISTIGGVTGFIEGFGEYAKHGDYKGGGGRAGLRIKI